MLLYFTIISFKLVISSLTSSNLVLSFLYLEKIDTYIVENKGSLFCNSYSTVYAYLFSANYNTVSSSLFCVGCNALVPILLCANYSAII